MGTNLSCTRGLEGINIHHANHIYHTSREECDVTLHIYVGAYFLSNLLRLNTRKYTSDNIPQHMQPNTCNTIIRIVPPLSVG